MGLLGLQVYHFSCCCFQTGSPERLVLLPLPLKHWNYRGIPQCSVSPLLCQTFLRQGLVWHTTACTWQVAEGGLELPVLQPPSSRCWDHVTGYYMQHSGLNPGLHAYVLGRHSTNWATPPGPFQYFFLFSETRHLYEVLPVLKLDLQTRLPCNSQKSTCFCSLHYLVCAITSGFILIFLF